MNDKMTRDEVMEALDGAVDSLECDRRYLQADEFKKAMYSVSALYDEVEALRNALEKIKLRCTEHPDDNDADRKRNLYHAHSIAKFALDRSSGSG